jgi:hypothetical protein
VATPFVQGHLLARDLSCTVETECAVTGRPIVFELDSELRYRILPPAKRPVLSLPLVDVFDLDSPCIVDDF